MARQMVDVNRLPKLSKLIVEQLQGMGLDVQVDERGVPTERFELKEYYSTENISTTLVEVNFFQTLRSAHANTYGGTNVEAGAGILELNSDVFVVGMCVGYCFAGDGTETAGDDAAIINNFGMIREIKLQDRRIVDPIFIRALPDNRGFNFAAPGIASAAVDIDGVFNGTPGQSWPPLLPPTNRFYVPAGERIDVPVVNFGATLSAARAMRVCLLGVKLQPKTNNPNAR